jgi:hypothetical protein
VGINIVHGTFHSLVALDPGSVFFEAKAGPYVSIMAAELAEWAPSEGDGAAVDYLSGLRALFT